MINKIINHYKLSSLVLFLSLGIAQREYNYMDLVYQDSLHYEKFTEIPVTGKIYAIYDNQNKAYMGFMKNGKREGRWVEWQPNGKKWREFIYSNNLFDGPGKEYYENGNIRRTSNYKNDVKHGKHILFRKNGKKLIQEEFIDGYIVHYAMWYENGNNKAEKYFTPYTTKHVISYGNFEENLDGVFSLWYENGQKEMERHYKDGLLHGSVKYWYENGQVRSIEDYINGKSEGKSISWYENGHKSSEAIYKDGKIGDFKQYNKDGRLKTE